MYPDMSNPSEHAEPSDPTEAVVHFIEKSGVTFERGEPRKYFTRFSRMNAGLTLSIVDPKHQATVIRLKNFYALWNFLVDDEIDRDGSSIGLDHSMLMLMHHSWGAPLPAELSDSARLLGKILEAVKQVDPGDSKFKARVREMFYFDFWALMTGFKHEACINELKEAANPMEYIKYTTLVGSIEHLLDLDCLFASTEVPPLVYNRLRVAYDHLGRSLKFASDIGSLQRELTEEDNLNLIRIEARARGIPEVEKKLSLQEFDALRPRLLPVVEEVRDKAQKHLKDASDILSEVSATHPNLDFKVLVGTVSSIVQEYFKGDVFFQQK